MAREIVIWPAVVLDNPTREVTRFGPELEQLFAEMMEAMHEAKGVGLAANQIGFPLRAAIVGRGDGTFVEMVNPRITAKREPVLTLVEGCLSVPGEEGEVPRYKEVDVTYQDRHGKTHTVTATERFAHVVQHEVDHLDGVVYVQHLSNMKRDVMRRKMNKLKRSQADDDE
jgi:peptide deformylase